MPDQLVHVVDDDPAMRESLEFLLDSAGLRVRIYESGQDLLERRADLNSGCIVTDVRMPQMNGLELVRRLRAAGVNMPVIVITGHGDIPLAVEAMREGVLDFIEKPFDEDVLLSAIDMALARGGMLDAQRLEVEKTKAAFQRLTVREHDVLAGLVAGKSNKAIALDHGISPRTVEIYRANVMNKTGATSLSELVRMAMTAERG